MSIGNLYHFKTQGDGFSTVAPFFLCDSLYVITAIIASATGTARAIETTALFRRRSGRIAVRAEVRIAIRIITARRYADIATAIPTKALRVTVGTAAIARTVASVPEKQIPKPTATATAVIAVSVVIASIRIKRIAHSISLPLVYLRKNLILYYMHLSAVS